MSTVQSLQRLAAAAFLSLTLVVPVQAVELKPYKDMLFAYPGILEQADNGAYLKVDYDKMRDIHERDEVPERQVKRKYVSLGVNWSQRYETVQSQGRAIDIMRVGKLPSAKFAVIFIHGRGGDRKLGADDFRFGGNFNRLKNLAAENDGVYIAASAKDFEDGGTADISALIGYIHQAAPRAKIVLSCASMGSFICWKITKDAAVVSELAGMMILGGATDQEFAKSAAFAARLPMFFSQGSDDTVYGFTNQYGLYKTLVDESYPTRFVLFQTGSHGTPVRMTDWRDSLNWIFQKSG